MSIAHHYGPISEQHDQDRERSVREVVWVLISILLLLYLVTSYVYWAKIESVWPVVH